MDRLPSYLVALSRCAHDPVELRRIGAQAAADLFSQPAAVMGCAPDFSVLATAAPAGHQLETTAWADPALRTPGGPLATACESGKPAVLAFRTPTMSGVGITGLQVAPIRTPDQVLGLLIVAASDAREQSRDHSSELLTQLAAYLATFLGTANALAQLRQSSLVVDALPDAIFGFSRNREVVLWNSGATRLYGIAEEDALGRPLDSLVPIEYGPPGSHGPAISLINRGQWSGRVRQRSARGEWLSVDMTIASVLQDGQLLGAVCINRDVTELVEAENRRAEHERRLQALLDASHALTAVIDRTGMVTAVNTAWSAGSNTSRPLAGQVGVGQDYLAELGQTAGAPAAELAEGVRAVLAGTTPTFQLDYDLELSDGTPTSFAALVAPMPGSAGGAFVSHTDISARKSLERVLTHKATHDQLTGLITRGQLARELQSVLGQAVCGTAVLILDLDRFKDVNDTLGHEAGDQVLIAMAARLGAFAPATHVARISGDEFALTVPDVRDHGELARLAADLQRIVAAPLTIEGRELFFGSNVGTVLAPADPERPPMSATDLLRAADTAMYRAKERGRNSVVAFDEGLRLDVARRVQLSSWLARALENDQISVHYQPQFSCLDGHAVGVEALVRWHHPVAGDVPPGEFIAIAEESGLIMAIGADVLGKACQEAARWVATAGEDFSVAVNLSPLQLLSADIVDTVRAALLRSRLPANCLTLEVTEGALIEDPEVASQTLARLRALGARISVDDFGTGYSSLAYLARFPLDELKIDRMFVRDLERGDRARSLVSGIVRIGHALGMRVVAEGVETPGQLRLLTGTGSDCYQGYLAGRPATAQQITDRLASGSAHDISEELAREVGRLW